MARYRDSSHLQITGYNALHGLVRDVQFFIKISNSQLLVWTNYFCYFLHVFVHFLSRRTSRPLLVFNWFLPALKSLISFINSLPSSHIIALQWFCHFISFSGTFLQLETRLNINELFEIQHARQKQTLLHFPNSGSQLTNHNMFKFNTDDLKRSVYRNYYFKRM